MNKIVLGVCSSIGIYKACEILRGFQKAKYLVQVIMTKNATKLISPSLFGALSGREVLVELFPDHPSGKIPHIDLARDNALLLIAPATANMIGKFAGGIADDFLSTFYIAVKCPVAVAPAMNENMYLHPQTQDNIRKLKDSGVNFIEPEKGYLACGDEGWGRLAAPEVIVSRSMELIKKAKSLNGRKVLVTAGPTREYLDPVRFLSNSSSGKMGYAIAQEAMRRGADVVLISGPTEILSPVGLIVQKVETTEQMSSAVMKHVGDSDIVIMAAAVSDFKFPQTNTQKIKKEKIPQEVKLVTTPDILKEVAKIKGDRVLVGFAAETQDLEKNALRKIKLKNLDLIVANDVSQPGVGFESDMNQVSIIHPDGKVIHTEKQTKGKISQIILDEIEDLLTKKHE